MSKKLKTCLKCKQKFTEERVISNAGYCPNCGFNMTGGIKALYEG